MCPLSIALIVQNNALWSEINTTLRDFPFRVIVDFHDGQDVEVAIKQLADRRPDIVFAELCDDSPASLRILTRLKAADPDQIVVALHPSPSVNLVVTALRTGADEFLHAPIKENLVELLKHWQEVCNTRSRGNAIAVISAKGGCGATTIACHSAVAIGRRAAAGKRALLMDFDLSTGLARFLMKSQNEYSILDAVRNLQKLDLSYWSALVSSKHTGLDILSAPEDLTSDERLDRSQVQHLLSFARRYYDWVVVDLGRGLGQLATAVLPEISQIYVVATHEIASLHVTKKIYRSLNHAGYPLDQVRLIINRAPDTFRTTREIEKALGTPVFASLPNDYRALYECYSSGRLLSGSSKLSDGIQSLAAGMMGERVEPKRSLVARMLRRCAARVLSGKPDQGRNRTQVFPGGLVERQEETHSGVPGNNWNGLRRKRPPLLEAPVPPVSHSLLEAPVQVSGTPVPPVPKPLLEAPVPVPATPVLTVLWRPPSVLRMAGQAECDSVS